MKDSTFYIIVIAIAMGAYFFLNKKTEADDQSAGPSEDRTQEINELRDLLAKEAAGNKLSEAEIARLEELVRKSQQAEADIEKAATERVIKAQEEADKKIADAEDRAKAAEAESIKWKALLARNEEAAAIYFETIDKSTKDLEEALIKLAQYEEMEEIDRQRKEAEDKIKQSEAAKREEQEWINAWNTSEWINNEAINMVYDLNPSKLGWVDDVIRMVLLNMTDKQLAILQFHYTRNTGRNLINDLKNASMSPPYRSAWGAKQYRGHIGAADDGTEFTTPSLINNRDRLLSKLYNIPSA